MKLNQYPERISQLQIDLHRLDLELSNLKQDISLIETEIDADIVVDKELKNDTQRKTKRSQLLTLHPVYWEYKVKFEGFKNQRQFTAIELEKIRNEFSVAKLEKREEIAKLETD